MQILFPSFGQEVVDVLNVNGIRYSIDGNAILFPDHNLRLLLVPLDGNIPEADAPDSETFFLYEDRWRSSRSITEQRLLSRLGVFRRIHARLCRVVSLQNCKDHGLSPDAFTSKAKKFLDTFHTYGYLKGQTDYLLMYKGDTVATAQFMKTYQPSDKDTDNRMAYEWTRYASLPEVRIAGGMGKVLKQFLSDISQKDTSSVEIMSYSDNEWGNGDVYQKLGFKPAGSLEPVTYHIDPKTFMRINPRQWSAMKPKLSDQEIQNYKIIQNRGSRKWRLLEGYGAL